MEAEKLKEILDSHALWLNDEGGERADLRYADLSDYNLSDSDLRGVNLRGAKNFYLLPVADYRGYSFAHAVNSDNGWLICAGCRRLPIEEAKEHWGPNYQRARDIGDQYLYAIEWLEKKLEGENA